MFNKPNLFHKAEKNVLSRTSAQPLGSTVSASAAAAVAGGGAVNPVPAATGDAAVKARALVAEAAAPVDGAGSSGGSRLIVGPDVKLKGAEILDCDTLVVEGRVEATMDSRVLRIAENGAYKGSVGIDIAEIHGHFEGELTARQQLLIHSTGRVSGKIRYGKILIEEGGELSGDVQSLASAGKEGLRAVDARASEPRPLAAVAG
ncbi:polymer-forming cytoskeletal protein [Thauera aromatica]|uniref:bactofilin family protein n=1 Tax=Thauera aromatica TaxID=59405 RepID=UPI001FFC6273|nr:polymer-forming cytoskeletal protein [Thauera aromatica]MCK2089463.1 polymer-forming cytoskeletal protein [Thauera aromatica]